MSETQKPTIAKPLAQLIRAVVPAVVNATIAGRIGRTLPEATGLRDEEVERIGVRFTGSRASSTFSHITWLNFDRLRVKDTLAFPGKGSNPEVLAFPNPEGVGELDGIMAETNDRCFLTGAAPSYHAHTPAAFADQMSLHLIDYLLDHLAQHESLEIMVQLTLKGHRTVNLFATSEDGFASLRERDVAISD